MGCDLATSAHRTRAGISIHASRMGCDGSWWFRAFHPSNFNPRIPYGMRHVRILFGAYHAHFNPRIPYGMRPRSGKRSRKAVRFQSTHPVWDATEADMAGMRIPRFQSTHPVWDATSKRRFDYPRIVISIHASRMGCDPCLQSQMVNTKAISIHASRMGCDLSMRLRSRFSAHFNPRIPYGMRPCGSGRHDAKKGFQSTHPVWDVTMLTTTETATRLFQSTHPVWDATKAVKNVTSNIVISIHASRMGCDVPFNGYELDDLEFQSTHPVWDATPTWAIRRRTVDFNPRIPYGMRLGL